MSSWRFLNNNITSTKTIQHVFFWIFMSQADFQNRYFRFQSVVPGLTTLLSTENLEMLILEPQHRPIWIRNLGYGAQHSVFYWALQMILMSDEVWEPLLGCILASLLVTGSYPMQFWFNRLGRSVDFRSFKSSPGDSNVQIRWEQCSE